MPMTFLTGSLLYPLIELGWRGRTHPSMALAGGAALCALQRISRLEKSRPIWQQALLGGLAITGIEYAVGLAFNRRYRIWDYRRMPLNVRGQVCAPFTLIWCGLSALTLAGMRALKG